MTEPHFANARSVRNAIDRARMRQANRMFAAGDRVLTKSDLSHDSSSRYSKKSSF